MKIAYFDCPAGISGNMILGALIGAGLEVDYLKRELSCLPARPARLAKRAGGPLTAYRLLLSRIKKHGTQGTYVEVNLKHQEKPRTPKKIIALIKKSKLSDKVRQKSIAIFQRLAAAEAKVHGEPLDKVHFHEVGQTDAMVDIVGAVIGLEKLRVQQIYCSELPYSEVAPATAELLKGIPVYHSSLKKELVTPTGAAIVTTLAESFGDMPRLKVEAIGYGAGSWNLPIPNLLRLIIGEAEFPTEKDAILQVETNIDDMDLKNYDRAIASIMRAGALDASIYPIRMKKKREAVKLEALCRIEDKDRILDAIFTETSTIGARVYLVKREKLKRKITGGKKISYLGTKIVRVKKD